MEVSPTVALLRRRGVDVVRVTTAREKEAAREVGRRRVREVGCGWAGRSRGAWTAARQELCPVPVPYHRRYEVP